MAGLLGGLGAGLQQAGANMHEQTKLQRIQEWQQRVRSEDREFQSQMYDRQRQDAKDDWDRKTTHDENMARLNASLRPASEPRLDPRIGILGDEAKAIIDQLKDENDPSVRERLQQQLSVLTDQRRQLSGLPSWGGLSGNDNPDDDSQSVVDDVLSRRTRQQNQQMLSDLEHRDRTNATIAPASDRPGLLHQALVPPSARSNRSRYNVGVSTGNEGALLGQTVAMLSGQEVDTETQKAILNNLPQIMDQLPPPLQVRARQLLGQ